MFVWQTSQWNRLAQEGLTPSKLREAASFEAEKSRKPELESSVNHLSMGPEEFDVLVERAFKKIPRRFRRRLANVVLVVEQEPPRPNLLGLYQGRPLTHRSVSEGFALPDKITIYQGPHERTARTPLNSSSWWRRRCGTRSRTTSAWTNAKCEEPKSEDGASGDEDLYAAGAVHVEHKETPAHRRAGGCS